MVKASEIIALLTEEIQKQGDLPVRFYGAYGASEEIFEILEQPEDSRHTEIKVWTGIMTG